MAGMIVAAIVGALLAIGLVTSAARAQSATNSVELLYLQGNDTLATERLSVTPTSWIGELTWKGQPRLMWTHTTVGSNAGRYALDVFAPGSAADAKPAQQAVFTMVRDSARVEMKVGAQSETQMVGTRQGAYVLFNRSLANMVMIGSATAAKGKPGFDVLLAQGGNTMSGTVRRAGDSLSVTFQGIEMIARMDAKGLPVEITVPSQNLRVVRVSGSASGGGSGAPGTNAASTAATSKRINYDAPANAPYTAEHVRIPTTRGYELAATYTRPTVSRLTAVAITISGSGGQDRDSRISIVPDYAPFREFADTLARRGVATLRFDDRGVGESGGIETMRTATSESFADDVRSIVAWLRKRPDVDTSRIMLIGHSEGGIIAPMVAASDDGIHGIALLAGPSYNGKRIMLHQNESSMKTNGVSRERRDSILATLPTRLDSLGRTNSWIGFFMQHEPLTVIRRVKQPVLIMQGMTDQQVTPEQADSIAATLHASGNHNVTLRKFESANHLFLDDASGEPANYGKLKKVNVRKDVLGALADWVVAQSAK
jgi:alpha-beta hydrolase superfamily lysophospholipase